MIRTHRLGLIWSIPLLAFSLLNASTVSLQTVKIADGVYQFVTSPDGYVPNRNSVVIVTDEDVLVFDTFTRPSTARLELGKIPKTRNHRYPIHRTIHAKHRQRLAGHVLRPPQEGPG